jgi:hypothetical protein
MPDSPPAASPALDSSDIVAWVSSKVGPRTIQEGDNGAGSKIDPLALAFY